MAKNEKKSGSTLGTVGLIAFLLFVAWFVWQMQMHGATLPGQH